MRHNDCLLCRILFTRKEWWVCATVKTDIHNITTVIGVIVDLIDATVD